MRLTHFCAILPLLAAGGGVGLAQSNQPPGAPPGMAAPGSPQALAAMARILAQPRPILTIDRPQTATRNEIVVTSLTFEPFGRIPIYNTGYGKSVAPEVSWSAGPAGTKSYYLIMEDGTAGMNREGVLHWQMFNIPADVTSIPEGGPAPSGAVYGANMEGKQAYSGPHAPVGGPPFHYHIQVFALDRLLDLPPGASRDLLWAAVAGHVLASGQVVGEFQGPSVAAYRAAGGQ